jgi:hypothetical protein
MNTPVTAPLTEELCQRAWESLQPTLVLLHGKGYTNKLKGTMIVLDPRIIDRPKNEHADKVFADSVLFKGFVGDVEEPKYTEIALGKALLTWKHGLPSSVIQQHRPHLYGDGDTIWGGSAINGGLITAFSGVQQVYDEAIAEMQGSVTRGMCRDAMTNDETGILWSGISFFGQTPELIHG